jgi:hypothetical protein
MALGNQAKPETGINDMDNILEAQGFQFETGGGGCQLLSRYMGSGAFVWATCLDGGGLPDQSNWMVCAYGDDIGDIIFELRSDENESGLTLEQAADQALRIAREFESEFELCRNGKPIANCDCC